ncbi:MAG TPA: cellulase family glycosylhydrolase [Polyangiaceae bacterium]|nr:cellulase family glycosylhydrolase [Polyangiaceae bacterium]
MSALACYLVVAQGAWGCGSSGADSSDGPTNLAAGGSFGTTTTLTGTTNGSGSPTGQGSSNTAAGGPVGTSTSSGSGGAGTGDSTGASMSSGSGIASSTGADATVGGGASITTGSGGSGGSGIVTATNTTGGEPEGLTAAEAAAAMGRGVNLGQMFESTQHSRTLAAASAKIDAYYARGFRNIRIPITWTEPVGGDLLVNDPAVGSVNRSHPRLQVIESIIDHALSKPDLYVVINAHHEVTLKTESRGAVLEQLWQDVADIFREKDYRLLFEVLNEPHKADGDPMPAADLRNMVGLAYARIREVDAERIVLFGGNQWFAAHEVPEVWTSIDEVGGGSDPYVMVTFHHYDPWTFCGDNQGTYDDAWTDSNQSTPMETMATWAATVGGGMPVYIGEWGVGWGSRYSTLTCNNIRQWYTTFDSVHATEYGQPTAVWDDGGWFKIFDHGSNGYNNNLVDCILGSCAWDGADRFSGCQ